MQTKELVYDEMEKGVYNKENGKIQTSGEKVARDGNSWVVAQLAYVHVNGWIYMYMDLLVYDCKM